MKGLKTGGRQKGTPNKLTSEIREKLNDYVFTEIDYYIENIDKIPIEKRLDFVTKIMPFVLPKQIETLNYNETDLTLNENVSNEKLLELKNILLKIDL